MTAYDRWKLDHPDNHADAGDEFDTLVDAKLEELTNDPVLVSRAWDEGACCNISSEDIANCVTVPDGKLIGSVLDARMARALRLLELVEKAIEDALEDEAQKQVIADLDNAREDAAMAAAGL